MILNSPKGFRRSLPEISLLYNFFSSSANLKTCLPNLGAHSLSTRKAECLATSSQTFPHQGSTLLGEGSGQRNVTTSIKNQCECARRLLLWSIDFVSKSTYRPTVTQNTKEKDFLNNGDVYHKEKETFPIVDLKQKFHLLMIGAMKTKWKRVKKEREMW